MPCSPGSRIPSGLPHLTEVTGTAPVGANAASARLGRSDDGRDHTVLPYADFPASPKGFAGHQAPFVQRGLRDTHGVRLNPSPRPALASATALPASTAARSAARDDVRPPLFAGSGWATHTTNPNFGKVEYFVPDLLTQRWRVLPAGQRKRLCPDYPVGVPCFHWPPAIFAAAITAWVRLSTPSFCRMAETCALMVASETPSS